MDLQLIRIDDRLIHGQVVVGWVRALNIERLVVANDSIAANAMQRTLMEMAVPPGLKLSLLTVPEAVEASRAGGLPERVLLLFGNPQDALSFVRSGGNASSLNVGGMRFCNGKRQVCKTVCVDDRDIQTFKELKALGLELEVRAVPGDPREPLEKYLPELKGDVSPRGDTSPPPNPGK
jgi:mannose/fructose/sorbose-specific phosphotransferase system IIB component